MPYKDKKDRARRDAEKRATLLAFLREYKIEKGCADCGYNKHHAGLQFDHLPQYEKTANVAALLGRNMDILMAEVLKCEVVCATCHAIRTFERGQYNHTNK